MSHAFDGVQHTSPKLYVKTYYTPLVLHDPIHLLEFRSGHYVAEWLIDCRSFSFGLTTPSVTIIPIWGQPK